MGRFVRTAMTGLVAIALLLGAAPLCPCPSPAASTAEHGCCSPETGFSASVEDAQGCCLAASVAPAAVADAVGSPVAAPAPVLAHSPAPAAGPVRKSTLLTASLSSPPRTSVLRI